MVKKDFDNFFTCSCENKNIFISPNDEIKPTSLGHCFKYSQYNFKKKGTRL